MNNAELKVLKNLGAIIYKFPSKGTDRDLRLIKGLTKILNDAEFERKHPRNKYGQFTDKRLTSEFSLGPFENQPADTQALSRREIESLYVAASGAGNNDIADEMVVTRHAVKAAFRRIFRKLKATDRLDAVVRGLQFGILDHRIIAEVRELYNPRAKDFD